LLHNPDTLRTDAGQPYTVFTPFWKRLLQQIEVPEPLPMPTRLIPVLYHHPQSQHQPLRPEFTDFPWSTEKSPAFKAWTKGRTGIPMVDAGMRQLWRIGWMHSIFNPVLQGRKFDPEGAYVRRWVPELAHLPNEYIQAPWEAPPDRLQQAGVVLGHSYPHPQESLEKSRLRALELFEQWTKRRKG
jgi:deoxyribodipyrimidine photo-lyase